MTGAAAATEAGQTPALELQGIDKRFGAVRALDGAGLRVAAGSIHAVVGENGAGKSTLMKVAYGELRADAGTLAIGGRAIDSGRYDPRAAMALGVGMVHQHFTLVPTLTVLENLVLGRETWHGPGIDLATPRARAAELARELGAEVSLDARVVTLSVGERQRVEILRVLFHGARILLLDEPTAVLAPAEVRELFDRLRALAAGGVTVVLVTHKLDEVLAIADRVTVMRRGRVVAELENEELDAEVIARAMVGRPVLVDVERSAGSPGDVALAVRGLSVRGRGARPALDGVDLEVRAGEIVGVAGVEGNGQRELVEVVAGLRAPSAGSVHLGERDVTRARVAARAALGLGHVPEDRHARGLVLDFSVTDNLMLGQERRFTRRGLIDRARAAERARAIIDEYEIRPDDPRATARTLSGGNQQKIVVGRELARDPLSVLVAAQPTRGVDIGAIELIHRRMLRARDTGVAVLLVSSELTELCALADRVVVLYRGRAVAWLDADQLAAADSIETMGELMTGARAEVFA